MFQCWTILSMADPLKESLTIKIVYPNPRLIKSRFWRFWFWSKSWTWTSLNFWTTGSKVRNWSSRIRSDLLVVHLRINNENLKNSWFYSIWYQNFSKVIVQYKVDIVHGYQFQFWMVAGGLKNHLSTFYKWSI